MAVKIRLSRCGRKKLPFYHILVADERCRRDGRNIEKIGHYDPAIQPGNEGRVVWNTERVNYWLSVGAQPTGAVVKMILEQGLGSDTVRARLETAFNRRKAIIGKRVEEKLAAEAAAKAAKEAEEAAKAKAAAEAAAAKAAEEAAAAQAAAEAAAAAPAEEAAAAAE